MQEKLINSLLIWIGSVWIIYLINWLIKLSDKISEEYSLYIFTFLAMSIFATLIQFAPDSDEE